MTIICSICKKPENIKLMYAVVLPDDSGETIELFKTEKEAKSMLKEIGTNQTERD